MNTLITRRVTKEEADAIHGYGDLRASLSDQHKAEIILVEEEDGSWTVEKSRQLDSTVTDRRTGEIPKHPLRQIMHDKAKEADFYAGW
jgi:hypothetical protein